ncbi:TIGR03086 family protein [Streptomyces roseirectus]|uniref:TIGR03086 family protein n=1 Tax=Streptomyces roseirectus TaxID=2768066 RepID=A0A7H0IB74_9ACTN|nr:TIGR03086 family metal-binding protein [Streptomyces roseirectus]QNP70040.1 TIGR03086 family protein [Streptomyces roseirectus]
MLLDPRPLYARAAAQVGELIHTVRPDALDSPTPCPDFDVRTLLSHLVGVTVRVAVTGETGDGLTVDAFAPGIDDDAWSTAFTEAHARSVKAWQDDALLATPVRVPWGEVPGAAALSGYVMELATHTWDLNESLGHPLHLSPEIGEFALNTALHALPGPDRPTGIPFASATPAPEGTDAYGKLAAWTGRPVTGVA